MELFINAMKNLADSPVGLGILPVAVICGVYYLWYNLKKLESDFARFQSRTDATSASLITAIKGEFATSNFPLIITDKGYDLLSEIGFNEFLSSNYDHLKSMVDSTEKPEIQPKEKISNLFFDGSYTSDHDFKKKLANIAHDKNLDEKELLFLMSTEFEKKYFEERFTNDQIH